MYVDRTETVCSRVGGALTRVVWEDACAVMTESELGAHGAKVGGEYLARGGRMTLRETDFFTPGIADVAPHVYLRLIRMGRTTANGAIGDFSLT